MTDTPNHRPYNGPRPEDPSEEFTTDGYPNSRAASAMSVDPSFKAWLSTTLADMANQHTEPTADDTK